MIAVLALLAPQLSSSDAGPNPGPDLQADPTPSISIIIDDLGNRLAEDQRALLLPSSVAVSVLPGAPHASGVAEAAASSGRETLVHLPMRSQSGYAGEHSELHAGLTRAQFSQQVREAVAAVPGAIGVNNHQGSLLTQNRQAMDWLMSDLRCLSPRLFVDSRTTDKTHALTAAREAGIASTRRDVFLDWQLDEQTIHQEFDRLLAKARRQGYALAIAHPHPVTLKVLEARLDRLAEEGVKLVPLSTYVEISQWRQMGQQMDHRVANGSWSPWPTAAKSLSR